MCFLSGASASNQFAVRLGIVLRSFDILRPSINDGGDGLQPVSSQIHHQKALERGHHIPRAGPGSSCLDRLGSLSYSRGSRRLSRAGLGTCASLLSLCLFGAVLSCLPELISTVGKAAERFLPSRSLLLWSPLRRMLLGWSSIFTAKLIGIGCHFQNEDELRALLAFGTAGCALGTRSANGSWLLPFQSLQRSTVVAFALG